MTGLKRTVRREVEIGGERVVVALIPAGQGRPATIAFRPVGAWKKNGEVGVPLVYVWNAALAKKAEETREARRTRRVRRGLLA